MPVQRFIDEFVLRRPASPECQDVSSADAAGSIGLQDAVMEGGYNSEAHELAPGFKITVDDTVVDVGCGSGGNSTFAARQGAAVISVDANPAALEELERRMRETPARSFRAVLSDSSPIPIPAGCASVVLAMEVMEHVDNPDSFIRELVRIGQPGARYLLSVPDPACEAAHQANAPEIFWKKPYHIRVFQRDEFAQLVEAAGLTIERRLSHGFYWAMWWLLRWTMPGTGMEDIPAAAEHDTEILAHWQKTWQALLASPRGEPVRNALNKLMPKSQVIIARKPVTPTGCSVSAVPSRQPS